MKRKELIVVMVGVLLFGTGTLGLAVPLGTAFTYQGELKENGALADGMFDFSFTIYDDPLAGNLEAGPKLFLEVPVTDGRFSVVLDFGSDVLMGTRCG